MELNFTPVRTSKNYGINSIFLDENDIKNAFLTKNIKNNADFVQKFTNFEILNGEFVKSDFKSTIENENYLNDELYQNAKLNSNFNLSLDILNTSSSPLILKFKLNSEQCYLNDVININICKNISSNIIFLYECDKDTNSFHSLNLKINLQDNSTSNIIFLSQLSSNSTNLNSIQSDLQKNAKLDIYFIDFACKNSIFNYKSKILGENSNSNLKSLYLGDENKIIDLNYLIEIYGMRSSSNMEIVGVLSDNAKKHFKGTIDFKKGCKNSTGNENEFCMLLSKNAKSKALPMILCTEEDVDGKHSSSVGKVDEKTLFYLMTRGLSQLEATRLVVKAKLNGIINSLFDEKLKVKILENIDRLIV